MDDFFREAARPWVSTGLYPQFFVITFPDLMQIHSIDIRSYNGKENLYRGILTYVLSHIQFYNDPVSHYAIGAFASYRVYQGL